MNRSLATAAVLLAACAAVSAQPTTQRKPGLWEVQTTTAGEGSAQPPNMKEMMANVPPERRAEIERMMKQRGVGASGKANSFRYCLSKEQAERGPVPPSDPDTDCTHKMASTSATEARFSFQCKRKDGGTVEGEGHAYDLTPTSYAMKMDMKVQHQGRPMQMQVEQKGRWVSADCKGVAPAAK